MKKFVCACFALFICLFLVSWGETGHRTVGRIAESHLTPEAKSAISALLRGQSLADVSTYADEIKSDPEYKYTASWHYINLPAGLNYESFRNFVIHDQQPNIYSVLLTDINYLKNPSTIKAGPNRIKGVEAYLVKWVVHLVGDMHQPMHVSRAEDRGGNSIQVRFDNNYTNLHALWDYDMIDKQRLSYQQIAKEYDTATPAQISKWQHDKIMLWLFESYQISTILYTEAEKNNDFDNAYYQEHLPVVKRRIDQAGIRLAGILNYCFSSDAAVDLQK